MRFFPVFFALTLPLAFASFELFPKAAIAQPTIKISQANSTYETELNRLIDNGMAKVQQKDYEGAIAIHQQALKLAKQNQNLQDESMVLWLLGRSYDLTGKYLLAESSFKEGLGIISQLEGEFHSTVEKHIAQSRLKVFLMTGLGITYSHLGEYNQAAKQLELAFALSANTTNAPKLVLLNYFETRFELAELYRKQGKYKEAIGLLQHSYLLASQMGDREKEAMSLTALGNNHALMGNLALAQQFYDRANNLGKFPDQPEIKNAPARVDGVLGELVGLSNLIEKIVPVLQKASRGIHRFERIISIDPNFVIVGKTANNLDRVTQRLIDVMPILRQGDLMTAYPMLTGITSDMTEMSKNLKELSSLMDSFHRRPEDFSVLKHLTPQDISDLKDIYKDLNEITQSINDRQKNYDRLKLLKKN